MAGGRTTTNITTAMSLSVVPIIFAFAFAAFIWGLVNYFYLHPGDEAKRAFDPMMTMKKIDVAAIKAARSG